MSDVIKIIPAVALRGLVVLPGPVTGIEIAREKSRNALERAMEADQMLFLTAQKDTDTDEPGQNDLYGTGVLARVRQVVKGQRQNNSVRILVEGIQRAELYAFTDCREYLEAQIILIDPDHGEGLAPAVKQAMLESIRETFGRFARVCSGIQKELPKIIEEITDLEKMIDTVINVMPADYREKQEILEEMDLEKRYQKALNLLFQGIDVQILKNDFQSKVKHKIDEQQKEYILREQMSVIREELGDDAESEGDEFDRKTDELEAEASVKEHLHREIRKFRNMNPNSGESSVLRNYIETLLELPWNHKSEDNQDLDRAEQILNRDHYGLDQVKDRILDFLAVRNLTRKGESPIICLVGPPGTGKTSIARSIAESLEKKYVRVCLGGVRDESEIRGHRRTYLGAMPGRIVDGLRQAKVSNPLMLLDEIDKASADYKGDTSAALLEVLDGEQNHQFRDHYVEVPVDLSEVLFIATANDRNNIPRPLLDRMEIIEVASYTENEKFHIAKEHLIRKQMQANGIKDGELTISDEALKKIIHGYTREAGVRALERRIGEICRKTARTVYRKKSDSCHVTAENLQDYLGREKYLPEKRNEENEVGIVRGLAWTAVGGVTLEVEVVCMPGKGEFRLTGQLGDVMKESASAGISYLRSIGAEYSIDPEFFSSHDIHIHIPEGATPKDGPSAGITMATAMLSAMINRPVRADLAMTGEITLRGRVLPIGGLKEKLLAAKNAGIETVCIPNDNERDLDDISAEILNGMHIVPVKSLKEVLDIALV